MRPNVLLVSLDTLRFDCIGAIGERRFLGDLAGLVSTPRIDEFASRHTTFTQAVSAAPFTTPSHASLFTGLWPTQHGAHHQYKTPIAAEARTLAERLSAAGYRTAQSAGRSVGEGVMFASDVNGLKRGYGTSIFAGSFDRATRQWLSGGWFESFRRRPWFLFFHTFAAHWPYGREQSAVEAMFDRAFERDDWDEVRKLYVENASACDAIVGELLDFLERRGELDRTIVVILSDHGEGLNRRAPLHGPIHGGREEVIRVPLVVRAPGAAGAGERVHEQVRTVDIAPTILDLAGVSEDDGGLLRAGVSMAGALLGGGWTTADRPAFFVGHLNDDPLDRPLLAGVRTTRWKLIVDDCTEEKVLTFERRLAGQPGAARKADLRGRLLREMLEAGEPVKLFDLHNDPLETKNVAAEEPAKTAELRALVDGFLTVARGQSDEGADSDEDLEAQLRGLGYLT
jgi:arylsulfatase